MADDSFWEKGAFIHWLRKIAMPLPAPSVRCVWSGRTMQRVRHLCDQPLAKHTTNSCCTFCHVDLQPEIPPPCGSKQISECYILLQGVELHWPAPAEHFSIPSRHLSRLGRGIADREIPPKYFYHTPFCSPRIPSLLNSSLVALILRQPYLRRYGVF